MKAHLTILQVFVEHARKQWIYVALVFFALLTAGAGLSSVLVINQAALQALSPPNNQLAYVITALKDESLTLTQYGQLRQAGAIDSIGVAFQDVEINDQLIRIWGVDMFPLLNNRLRARMTAASGAIMGGAIMPATTAKMLPLEMQTDYAANAKTATTAITLPNGKIVNNIIVGEITLPQFVRTRPHFVVVPLLDFYALFPDYPAAQLDGIYLLSERSEQALAQLKTTLGPKLSIRASNQTPDAMEMGKSFSFHLVAMGALMTVVSMFIVTNALSMLLAYRHQTIASLHKIGIAKKSITWALVIELSLYCMIGSLLGVLLGFWLMTTFDMGITATLSDMLSAPFSFADVSFLSLAALCLLLCTIGVIIAAALPLQQALRTDNQDTGHTLPLRSVAVAITLAVSVALLMLQFKTKLADLSALGLFILSACALMTVLLPILFRQAAALINKQWVLTHWALKSAEKLSSRCKLAASAYFIALACAIGLSGMIDSFRLATDNWLSQRLAAQAYVYSNEAEKVPQSPDIELVKRINAKGKLAGEVIRLNDFPLDKHYQQSMVFAASTDHVWQQFRQGKGILVNEQFAFRNQLELGATYSLSLDGQSPVQQKTVTLVGIYFDYGNPAGKGLLPPHLLADMGSLDNVVALHATNKVDWQAYQSQLASVLPNASFLMKGELMDLSMAVFDRTFVLTDGLILVSLIVAALSFAITIGLLSRHLQTHVRTLSALGVEFSRIRWAILFQFALLCLLVTLLAIPAGILLSYLLITTVNVNAFGWTYPLELNLMALFKVCASGFIAMLCVCWFAIQRVTAHKLPGGFSAPVIVLSLLLVGCHPAPERQPIFANVTSGVASDSNSDSDYMKYSLVNPNVSIQLPTDHSAHNSYQLEWWYFTSVLRDELQRPYPFQYTLFRFNRAGTQTYMAHASLHTPDEHWFEERFADADMPYLQTDQQPFSLRLDDWQWSGADSGAPFPADLQIQFWQGPKVELRVSPTGPYILHGEQGVSIKSADAQHVSYYYSQPFLQASGTLSQQGETRELGGNAWYDHEWTSQLVNEQVDGWDWFSVHLDNGNKVMVFRLRIAGKPHFFTGTHITATGQTTQLHQSDFTLTPMSDDAIPQRWQLRIPSQEVDISISPFKSDQWNCGLFTYYEGGIEVTGSHSGEGFMELTGYAASAHACSGTE